MKKSIFIIPFILLLATSCDWFEFDNYEAPNAQVTGAFKDAKTGELVAQECFYVNQYGGNIGTPTDGYISAFQQGWDFEQAAIWLVRYDGTYQHTKIFAGDYRLEANQNNFYPISQTVTINKGPNIVDWNVTPYVRIIDPKITYEAASQKIKATFKLEYGDPSRANTIFMARLCCWPDTFVGIHCNNCSNDPGSFASTTIVADGQTVNELFIDSTLAANYEQFKYKPRKHYLRLAVCAVGKGTNTSRHYNYSHTVSIDL